MMATILFRAQCDVKFLEKKTYNRTLSRYTTYKTLTCYHIHIVHGALYLLTISSGA